MGATRTYIVDLGRLERAGKDGVLVVRLMMALNDINLALQCARDFRQEQPGISKHAAQANRRYFIQLQCGHLHEALKLVKEVEQSPVLTTLITRGPRWMQEAYQPLLDYMPGGSKHGDFRKYIISIRDKVVFHYDAGPVQKALAQCRGRLGARRTTITLGSAPTLGRFDVADDIIDTIVARQMWDIPPSADVQAEADRIADWGWEICRNFLRFGYELVHRYIRQTALAK